MKVAVVGCLMVLTVTALVLMVTGGCETTSEVPARTAAPPPETMREPVVDTLHGEIIVDPYRWLEDQWSPRTRSWIEAQNRYTSRLLAQLPGREELHSRFEELMRRTAVSRPVTRRNRLFYSQRLPDQELSALYMREGAWGEEKLLVDPAGLSEDGTVSVSLVDISIDGGVVAYGIRQGGADEMEVHFLHVDSMLARATVLPDAVYFGVAMTPDGRGVYYSRRGQDGSSRVYYHRFGSTVDNDRLVFGDGFGPDKGISIGRSDDNRLLIVTVWFGSVQQTEVYYKDMALSAPIQPLVTGIEARFRVSIAEGQVFASTDWKAPNRRLLRGDLDESDPERWRDLIPEDEAVLSSFDLVGGMLSVRYEKDMVSYAAVYDLDGNLVREIETPTLGNVGLPSGLWDNPYVYYTFESYTVPPMVFRSHIETGETEVWHQAELPIDPDSLQVRQVWYESADGTRVPMFVVHRRDLTLDGDRPTIIYGYGGFSVSTRPWFSSSVVLWTELGGVFAYPALRGGGEYGETWHRAGMRENKQNTFDDLYAAAEWLIANDYTNPERLACSGGSNGGLLVGVALTQRPDLFGAVVCTYPLLDMIRYHKLLMGPYWIQEYGSADDAEEFEVLLSYSPYHNVQEGVKYPAVMFVTGDHDTRVDPMHARKMTAMVQQATTSQRPVLLRYEERAGHSGGKPVSATIQEQVDIYSFLLWQLESLP